MGILIILMAVGITAGRFAINRANDVAHQNAVDQIYQGLQAYYTDNREYPDACNGSAGDCTIEDLVGTSAAPGTLGKYLDEGAFDGGTEASYYYFVDTDVQQTVLVCVSKGGADDSKSRGLYCNGNAFGVADFVGTGGTVTDKDVPVSDAAPYTTIIGANGSEWNGNSWGAAI
jgi:type II secretory pathway pseudopilin PulG